MLVFIIGVNSTLTPNIYYPSIDVHIRSESAAKPCYFQVSDLGSLLKLYSLKVQYIITKGFMFLNGAIQLIRTLNS